MPLIGWTKESKDYKTPCKCEPDFRHPYKNGNEVDCFKLDHFARICPDPPFDRGMAEALFKTSTDHMRYGSLDPIVSATMLTACPLHLWFERNHDFVLDPLKNRWMLKGTVAHEAVARLSRSPRFIIEQPLRWPINSGLYLYGTPDRYDVIDQTLHDLKTQKWWAIDKKKKMTKPKILADKFVKYNVFQMNCYKVMWEACMLMPVEAAYLHYWNGDLEEVKVEAPLVDTATMAPIMQEKGVYMYFALNEKEPSKIEPKDYGAGWNPREDSALWWMIKEEMQSR